MKNRTSSRAARAGLTFALMAAIAIAPPYMAFADGGDGGIEASADGLSLHLAVGSGAPRKGTNEVRLEVRNAQGEPLQGAVVTLTVAMDQKASMSMDMNKEEPKKVLLVESTSTPGTYQGNVDLGFVGAWIVSMELSRADQTTMTDFALEVEGGGPNWAIVGSFGGAVVLVIVAAAVVRSRRGRAKSAEGTTP